MANQPVQLVTNPQQLSGPRTKNRPAKAGTDFYDGRDAAFASHRDGLVRSLQTIIAALGAPETIRDFGGLAHIKVTMAANAIAKSHRPQKKVVPSRLMPPVATAG